MPIVRLVLSALSAVLLLVAGADMRAQGSGVDHSFGLVAYAAALAVLAYGVGGLQGAPRGPAPRQLAPERDHYREE